MAVFEYILQHVTVSTWPILLNPRHTRDCDSLSLNNIPEERLNASQNKSIYVFPCLFKSSYSIFLYSFSLLHTNDVLLYIGIVLIHICGIEFTFCRLMYVDPVYGWNTYIIECCM